MASKKLAFAGNKYTTLECMTEFLRSGHKIDLLITLLPEKAEKGNVAGYFDLRDFAAEHGIELYHPQTYSLKAEADEEAIKALNIDCLLVMGWQRLIPEWLLKHLSVGAFGMHGSPEPLPRGRGRSPLNWSLLGDKPSFVTHLFRYDAGVDSGDVVASQKFEINNWDDCHTLHLKNRMAMTRLLHEHIDNILAGTAKYKSQSKEIEPTYFPKRTDEDGHIVWEDMDMRRLFNHVRCQTHPFPGAFSFLEGTGNRFYFWTATPFDPYLTFDDYPGTVTEVFSDGSFLVAVWDGSVRVTDYSCEGAPELKPGMRFKNIEA